MRADEKGADRMRPRPQADWDARAATNFICGGAGGGLLVMTALPIGVSGDWRRVLTALALALVACGLTAVWFEIGRPLRALNVYRNALTSWMTREAMIAPLVFAAGLAAIVSGRDAAFWAAGLAGLAFAFAQGRMLRRQLGIPAWRHPACADLMLATGLAEGAGLVGMASLAAPSAIPYGLLIALLAGLRLALWRRYRVKLREAAAPAGSLRALDALIPLFRWAGGVLPIVFGAAGALAGSSFAVAVAGAAAVALGVVFKYVLICRAGLTQGLSLPRIPQRGGDAPGRSKASVAREYEPGPGRTPTPPAPDRRRAHV